MNHQREFIHFAMELGYDIVGVRRLGFDSRRQHGCFREEYHRIIVPRRPWVTSWASPKSGRRNIR